MSITNEPGTDLVRVGVGEESVDPEALHEAERRVSEVERLAQVVAASVQEAEDARSAAQLAKTKSAGLGQKKAAIEALQDAGVAASAAISSLAESQQNLFENQRAFADYIRELTDFALGSVANTRLVYRELQAKLSGASEGELDELARRELRFVVQEFKRQLDLAERQEQADKKLSILRDELSRQKALAEQAIADAQGEHALFHQAAASARSNATRLDAVLEDLELQREADNAFNESMRLVFRRLDEVELLSANTATSLSTEGVHGEQRDESIAQLFALAASNQDAVRNSDVAIAGAAQSTIETVDRLRRHLRVATILAVAGVVVSVASTLLALMG